MLCHKVFLYMQIQALAMIDVGILIPKIKEGIRLNTVNRKDIQCLIYVSQLMWPGNLLDLNAIKLA